MKTYPLYLNGDWFVSSPFQKVVNPANGDVIAQFSTIDRARVARAMSDAHAAFPGWKKLTGKIRGDFLLAIAEEIDRRSQEIARLITMENGKPLPQSSGEVAMSIDHLRWFAEEARRAYGRIV